MHPSPIQATIIQRQRHRHAFKLLGMDFQRAPRLIWAPYQLLCELVLYYGFNPKCKYALGRGVLLLLFFSIFRCRRYARKACRTVRKATAKAFKRALPPILRLTAHAIVFTLTIRPVRASVRTFAALACALWSPRAYLELAVTDTCLWMLNWLRSFVLQPTAFATTLTTRLCRAFIHLHSLIL